jgi:uncharacterized membrane protein YjjP (DUF1212 family)
VNAKEFYTFSANYLMFIQLLAIAFAAVTLPIWGGALTALVAGGLMLAVNHPILLLAIFAAPFVLRAFL